MQTIAELARRVECERLLAEWRDLSRELVDMGAGDLAAMVEDARMRLTREARRGRS